MVYFLRYGLEQELVPDELAARLGLDADHLHRRRLVCVLVLLDLGQVVLQRVGEIVAVAVVEVLSQIN